MLRTNISRFYLQLVQSATFTIIIWIWILQPSVFTNMKNWYIYFREHFFVEINKGHQISLIKHKCCLKSAKVFKSIIWFSGHNANPKLMSLKVGSRTRTHIPIVSNPKENVIAVSDKNNDRKFMFLSEETQPDYRWFILRPQNFIWNLA